jgi:hypothetical protein
VEALAILSTDCLIVEVLSVVWDTASLRLGCQIINWVMFLQSLSCSIGRQPLLVKDLIYLIDVVFVEIFVKLLLARRQMRSGCVFLLSCGHADLHLALTASCCSLSASLLGRSLIRLRWLRSQMSTLAILRVPYACKIRLLTLILEKPKLSSFHRIRTFYLICRPLFHCSSTFSSSTILPCRPHIYIAAFNSWHSCWTCIQLIDHHHFIHVIDGLILFHNF